MEITDTQTQLILFDILKKYYPEIIRIKTTHGYPKYYYTEYDMFSYYYNKTNNTYKAVLHFYDSRNNLMVDSELAQQLKMAGLVSNEFIFYYDILRHGAKSFKINYIAGGIIVNNSDYKTLLELQHTINCIRVYADKSYDKSRREYYGNKVANNTINCIREDCHIFKNEYLTASSKIFNTNNKKLKA